MKRVLSLLLLFAGFVFGQFPAVNTWQFSAGLPPAVQTTNSMITGTPGQTAYYYWVVARYPSGYVQPAVPAFVLNAPNTLSGSNYVTIAWNVPAPQVTGYDVLRSTGASFPGSGTNAVTINTTSTSVQDQGSALSSYTFVPVTPATVSFQLNNRDYGAPTLVLMDASGNRTLTMQASAAGAIFSAGSSFGTYATATDATATGITISAARMLNGILAHSPTSGVNDATDSAANLVAGMPGCVVGSTFEFYLKNTSASAISITVTAGANVSLTGTMTVAQNNVRFFSGVVTNCATPAVTLYSLGTSAF
jgi:hypothetical protein